MLFNFPIRYHFDGNLFNLRRLQAKTKVQTDVLDVLDEFLYVDDMGKNASSGAKMQRVRDQVSQSIPQSAQQIQSLYTNQHLENCTMNQPSL